MRAGQPLPKIVYEEDDSLLYVVWSERYTKNFLIIFYVLLQLEEQIYLFKAYYMQKHCAVTSNTDKLLWKVIWALIAFVCEDLEVNG